MQASGAPVARTSSAQGALAIVSGPLACHTECAEKHPCRRGRMKVTALLFLSGFIASVSVAAESPYPVRPIRLIVPSAPGGGPDVGSRIIAAELSAVLGQNVVVENRPGASTTIGTEAIVRATPDGYTFGQGNFSSLNTTRILMKVPYDTMRDLRPIAFAYMSRNMLAVNRTLPVAHPSIHCRPCVNGV